MFTETLYCGEGKCTTYWRERDYELWCKSSTDYTVEFTISDKDGHVSTPWEVVLE
jgi:hypothetical protein